ncbi:small ubiquitin like modifier 2a isoform X2 [Ctenopharyngodon idella]|uniref:small ubiquitin like modifier 2a isoform X2 n=1 Tax=Ctenopharyngodon idella TaxID=7959 RepID=UPI0022305042|nr:small ubiquitin like modifier 2a isoform X2 [Ctenopharyngodon idella]
MGISNGTPEVDPFKCRHVRRHYARSCEAEAVAVMADEKPKEGVKTENDHINLKVAGQDGSVVQFKIKRHTPLNKLMKAYCERQLEMEDEDTIDVFQQQTGGLM